MNRRHSARAQELAAVAARPARRPPKPTTGGEVGAMLVRRGFDPRCAASDLPLPDDFDETRSEALCTLMHHYAFRLFLRGAIQRSTGFAPRETTRYLAPARAAEFAHRLVALGLAERIAGGRYRLRQAAHSFGGLLEWFVAREIRRELGFEVATRVQIRGDGVGGDLDVVAAAEGLLFYFELKSSPPRNVAQEEVAAFLDRLRVLRPDAALFVIDTALRLSDKVIPLLVEELARRAAGPIPATRLAHGVWTLTSRLAVVGARPDLMSNIRRAVAVILRSYAPAFP